MPYYVYRIHTDGNPPIHLAEKPFASVHKAAHFEYEMKNSRAQGGTYFITTIDARNPEEAEALAQKKWRQMRDKKI